MAIEVMGRRDYDGQIGFYVLIDCNYNETSLTGLGPKVMASCY